MAAVIFWKPGFSGNLHLDTDETICIGIDQRGIQYLHKVRLFYNCTGYSTFAYGITASQSGGNLEKCSKTVDFDGFGEFRQHWGAVTICVATHWPVQLWNPQHLLGYYLSRYRHRWKNVFLLRKWIPKKRSNQLIQSEIMEAGCVHKAKSQVGSGLVIRSQGRF